MLALTATAAPHVREHILHVLGCADPTILVGDPERHNIDVSVAHHSTRDDAIQSLATATAAESGTGIVYVGTRRETAELAELLTNPSREALAYHGSMSARERAEVLGRFRSGADVVVVATNAFGLGIDAPHVRWVRHLDAPESIDSYYQEIGRAGRDGEPATAVLHVVTAVAGSRRFAAVSSVPEVELHAQVARIDRTMSIDELRRVTGASTGRIMQSRSCWTGSTWCGCTPAVWSSPDPSSGPPSKPGWPHTSSGGPSCCAHDGR
ncbi:MAG: recQ 2 [Acidimicrobiales bacterium]|nr:recQ 2 [Acidimicrobiales bacterium]